MVVRCREGRAVIREATRQNGDIPAAARALGVALIEHSVVLVRAKAAVARIEPSMLWAQRTGVLHEFNQEYRHRTLPRSLLSTAIRG
jgi:hypothetical protein